MMYYGLGDASTPSQINAGVSAAGIGVSAAASAGLLTTLGITAAAVPVIGAVVAGVTLLVAAFGVGKGCGATCTLSTQVVNQAIPLMQKNLAAAQAQAQINGGCLTADERQQCLNNFDQVWQYIVSSCTQVGGPGGSQCIADRQRGGKYDCFVTLRDPIDVMRTCDSAGLNLPGGGATNGVPLLALGLIVAGLLL